MVRKYNSMLVSLYPGTLRHVVNVAWMKLLDDFIDNAIGIEISGTFVEETEIGDTFLN